jgi:mRNA interferase MazF
VRDRGDRAPPGRRPLPRRGDPPTPARTRRACTTTIRGLISEVGLEPGEEPVPRRCVVNMDSVESVSVAVLVVRHGRLADPRMRQMCAALAVAVDCADRRCLGGDTHPETVPDSAHGVGRRSRRAAPVSRPDGKDNWDSLLGSPWAALAPDRGGASDDVGQLVHRTSTLRRSGVTDCGSRRGRSGIH